MKANNFYRDAPFSTYEAAEILGMEKHKAQVVGWTRRHLKPFEIDEANPKKKMMRLDLVNIFELFLIKTLKGNHLKPGLINDIVNKDQVQEILLSTEREYLTILGGFLPTICNAKSLLFLLEHSSGVDSVLLINFQEIKGKMFEGIKKVRK
jgi:hypothetical protein